MGQIASLLRSRAKVQSLPYRHEKTDELSDASSSCVDLKTRRAEDLAASLRPIYTRLFDKLDLAPPERSGSKQFKAALLKRIAETEVPCPENSHSWQCMMVGFSYADLCLPYHPLKVKVWAAMYAWLSIVIDDAEALGIVAECEQFQERWLRGEKQPSVLLETYAQVIREAYVHYDPLVANLMVSSSFHLVTATCTEARHQFKNRVPTKGGQNFPAYLRERNGDAEAFGYFTWCKELFPDISVFMESMPDTMKFLNLGNDVLSFYKEELAGDSDNYIHSVARYQNKGVYTVLEETAVEVAETLDRINSIFKGMGEYEKAWNLHARGYIGMHKMRARYRLWEVGVGQRPDVTEKVR